MSNLADLNPNVLNALRKHLEQQQQQFNKMQELKPLINGFCRGEFYTILHNLANCINETNYILNGCTYQGYKEIRVSEL